MNTDTFIFIGRSGCGKGTQAKLLMEKIKEREPDAKIAYLETGNEYREFIKGKGLSQNLAENILKAGGLQPNFLTVWIWASFFVRNLKGGEHVFIDGTPRKLDETKMLDSAMKFYSRKNPAVIHLKVGRQWSFDRLKARGRSDDKDEEINRRLDWYDSDVMPAIEYYRANPDYRFIEIEGERPIAEIQNELAAKIGL